MRFKEKNEIGGKKKLSATVSFCLPAPVASPCAESGGVRPCPPHGTQEAAPRGVRTHPRRAPTGLAALTSWGASEIAAVPQQINLHFLFLMFALGRKEKK